MTVTPTYSGFIWAGDGHSGVRVSRLVVIGKSCTLAITTDRQELEVRVTPSGQIKIERHVKREKRG